jgi:hypothetical protein
MRVLHTLNFTPEEIAADPVHLILENAIEQFGEEK